MPCLIHPLIKVSCDLELHLRDLATHYVDFYGYTWSDPRASLEAAIIQQRIQLRKAQEYQESGGV